MSSVIILSLRYKDAPAAIEWLCEAFGFEKHLIVPGDGDKIAHAQLTFGNSMIMLGSSSDDDAEQGGDPQQLPDGIGSKSAYIVVDDADAHAERAQQAGATIEVPVEDADYGGRFYACRDCEGQVWNFGTYNPWVAEH